jgi:hypothetical protein
VATDDLQPSTTKALTDIARIMIVNLSVLVKQTGQGIKKMILTDVDVARCMIRPRRGSGVAVTAAITRAAMNPVRIHPTTTHPAHHHPGQRVLARVAVLGSPPGAYPPERR